MKNVSLLQNENRLATAGLIFIIPALILATSGILFSIFGLPQFNQAIDFDLWIFHPLVVMGGLMAAFGLNLLPVVRLNVRLEEGSLISTIKIQGKPLSLALIGLVTLLVMIIFVYLLAENLQIFAA